MIVLKSDAPRVSEVFAHYQIIRREGAVVPFEINPLVEAMKKVFLALLKISRGLRSRTSVFGELLFSFAERVSCWPRQLGLLALDFKRAALAQGACMQRSIGTGMRIGAGAGRGFFSAVKPNLRNAP